MKSIYEFIKKIISIWNVKPIKSQCKKWKKAKKKKTTKRKEEEGTILNAHMQWCPIRTLKNYAKESKPICWFDIQKSKPNWYVLFAVGSVSNFKHHTFHKMINKATSSLEFVCGIAQSLIMVEALHSFLIFIVYAPHFRKVGMNFDCCIWEIFMAGLW